MTLHNREKEFDTVYLGLQVPKRQHSRRVGVAAFLIAYASGFSAFEQYDLSNLELKEAIINGGRYHDLGLKQKGVQLSREDQARFVRKHPIRTEQILNDYADVLADNDSKKQIILEMAKYHHEQYDGGGYPFGLKGKEIPLVAGICAAANDLDNEIWIPYKTKNIERSMDTLIAERENVYGPQVITCVLDATEQLKEMYEHKGKCNAYIDHVLCGRLL